MKIFMLVVTFVASILFGQIVFALEEVQEMIVKKSVQADIKKDHEEFSLEKLSPLGIGGYLEHNVFEGKLHYGRIISGEGEILGYFPAREMNAVVCFDGGLNGGCENLTEAEIQMQVPLIPGGEMAEIFSPQGEKILTIDLPQ